MKFLGYRTPFASNKAFFVGLILRKSNVPTVSPSFKNRLITKKTRVQPAYTAVRFLVGSIRNSLILNGAGGRD